MPVQVIDWTSEERQLHSGQNVATYFVACTGCGYTRRLTVKGARKSVKSGACFHCSQKAKAKLGFRATVNRYGWRWAIPHVKATLDSNPSRPEQRMANLLRIADLQFSTNVILSTKSSGRKKWSAILDFVIPYNGVQYVVEVDGKYYHDMPDNVKRDRRKERLLRRRRMPLLRIDSREVNESAIDRVWAFITATEAERMCHAEMRALSA